jgi:nitroreductase
MTRTFKSAALPADLLGRILDAGRRAPSAGFTQGVTLLALAAPQDTQRFWDHVGSAEPSPGGRWDRLRAAPVIVLPIADRQAYVDRYAQADKATDHTVGPADWPVPYWQIDAAFAAMAMLLAATDESVGALFFAITTGTRALAEAFGWPSSAAPIGAVALGLPAAGDIASPSVARGRRADVIHWGRWGVTEPG